MLTFTTLSTLALAALTVAAPVELKTRTTCYSGVYVIGVRGSEEDAGFGSTATVVNDVLEAIPSSGSIALDYPASVVDPIYSSSVTDGIKALITLVQDYADACEGKIVLVGFSQGGNVITDALAGGVLKPTPLTASYVDHISAVTVFGDPTFTHGQTFDAGTDTSSDGIFSRGHSSLELLNTYADKIQSYCDVGDVYCASGSDTTAHREEIPTWATAAETFIVSKST
ncbi:acetyl xylan esterase [Grosmannia clavigera kw1407]|uniref:Acetyl xylan esterase n=1 Tax=Grosmannia clavigera (strain kw1407 / UAMH 11150) TaxID=655863 RepID=F0X8S2_GROCL|nr:acetyl xylan esterase [Grosmannia clavigera kw1407]EFX05649.1 acetyl xylan esterase [Grosmannia clavigera kw1407]